MKKIFFCVFSICLRPKKSKIGFGTLPKSAINRIWKQNSKGLCMTKNDYQQFFYISNLSFPTSHQNTKVHIFALGFGFRKIPTLEESASHHFLYLTFKWIIRCINPEQNSSLNSIFIFMNAVNGLFLSEIWFFSKNQIFYFETELAKVFFSSHWHEKWNVR